MDRRRESTGCRRRFPSRLALVCAGGEWEEAGGLTSWHRFAPAARSLARRVPDDGPQTEIVSIRPSSSPWFHVTSHRKVSYVYLCVSKVQRQGRPLKRRLPGTASIRRQSESARARRYARAGWEAHAARAAAHAAATSSFESPQWTHGLRMRYRLRGGLPLPWPGILCARPNERCPKAASCSDVFQWMRDRGTLVIRGCV